MCLPFSRNLHTVCVHLSIFYMCIYSPHLRSVYERSVSERVRRFCVQSSNDFSWDRFPQCDSISLKIIFPFVQDHLPPESCCYDDQVDAVATMYLIYFGFWPNWNIGIPPLQSLLSRPSWLQIFNERLSISWRSMLTSVQFNNCCNQIACNRSDHQ